MPKAVAFVSRPKMQNILGNSEVIKELIFEHTQSSGCEVGRGAGEGELFKDQSRFFCQGSCVYLHEVKKSDISSILCTYLV